MSKAEIIAELANLTQEDLAEIQAKLDELAANTWRDQGELSDADKRQLELGLARYAESPNDVSSCDEVEARLRARRR